MDNSPQGRVERHRLRQARLGRLSDDQLRGLIDLEGSSQGSWGGSGMALLDGEPVFVKRIPLTDIDVAHPFSTRNLHGLPTFYQYGVGSAGFGAFRELAAQEQATSWVLDGLTDGFAILHHHRILERSGAPWVLPMERDSYVAMWNDDPAVAGYVDARMAARHELWTVSEHLPHMASQWLVDHQDRAPWLADQLLDIASVMRAQGMVHFDAHLDNVVTDGEVVAVVDFGLALSSGFELSDDERAFLGAHTHYDLGEMLVAMAMPVHGRPEIVEPPLAELIERYRPVIKAMAGFFTDIRTDSTKAVRFDDGELVRLLGQCGVSV